ncbi:YfgM family protein [Aquabacterium humicola]|uniref:YfgM family protein n=1 Tax=Aquabacterium humicola TaxID=3237377 RepID=UPI002542C401|nr:tetratricopeptide repeat protein [Rubrivivax pictus]
MAKQLDLQEQEQLDELKAFWKQYGNLITGVLTLALLAFAAWNGWNWYQRDQAKKAGAMFEALEQAAAAGDAARGAQVLKDLQERYPRTTYAQQGGLIAAKLLAEKGQADQARVALTWVADNAPEDEYKTIARLRLAGVLMEAKQYDEGLKQLAGATAPDFAALVADRRGDVLLAQGKKDEAKAAYEAAYKGMDEKLDYRRLVDAKLTALGAAPAAAAASAAASGASR